MRRLGGMINSQPVFRQIPQAVYDEGAKKLKELDDLFAQYLTPLDDVQRKKMLKASNKTASFIEKSGEYCQTNPTFLPTYYTATQVTEMVKSNQSLRNFFQALTVFNTNMSDTAMVSSGATFAMLLKYYNSVKEGAKLNMAGASAIYKELSARFPGRKKNKPTPVVTESTAPTGIMKVA